MKQMSQSSQSSESEEEQFDLDVWKTRRKNKSLLAETIIKKKKDYESANSLLDPGIGKPQYNKLLFSKPNRSIAKEYNRTTKYLTDIWGNEHVKLIRNMRDNLTTDIEDGVNVDYWDELDVAINKSLGSEDYEVWHDLDIEEDNLIKRADGLYTLAAYFAAVKIELPNYFKLAKTEKELYDNTNEFSELVVSRANKHKPGNYKGIADLKKELFSTGVVGAGGAIGRAEDLKPSDNGTVHAEQNISIDGNKLIQNDSKKYNLPQPKKNPGLKPNWKVGGLKIVDHEPKDILLKYNQIGTKEKLMSQGYNQHLNRKAGRESTAIAMGDTSANGLAELIGKKGGLEWEWLHIRADSLNGKTNKNNLVLGTKSANTAMIPIEQHIRALARESVSKDSNVKLIECSFFAQGNPLEFNGLKVNNTQNEILIKWKLELTAPVKNGLSKIEGEANFFPHDTKFVAVKDKMKNIISTLQEQKEGYSEAE